MCQLGQLPTSWCRCPLGTQHYVMYCLNEITCFLSWSLLHLIRFNLFHLISWSPFFGRMQHVSPFDTCAFPHETAGGWPLQTNMPFLRYLPDIPCDPKSMAGNPRHILIAIFTQICIKASTLSVMRALVSYPVFVRVHCWVWTLCKKAGQRKLLSIVKWIGCESQCRCEVSEEVRPVFWPCAVCYCVLFLGSKILHLHCPRCFWSCTSS